MSDIQRSEFEDSYEDQRQVRGAILTEELGSVPRGETVFVEASTPIAEAIRKMNDNHVGCTLVLRHGKLAGIFTERDVLRRVVGSDLNLKTTPVEKVMTADPDTLPATASIAFALREMSVEGYRNIPLVGADGSATGMVSVRDIITWLVGHFPASVHNLPPTAVVGTNIDGG